MPQELTDEIAANKIALAGLAEDVVEKYRAQLSGGMRKRAALAHALALDPEILFLDEPTPGLDAISVDAFDAPIMALQSSLGVTVFLVTHDLDTLFTICDASPYWSTRRSASAPWSGYSIRGFVPTCEVRAGAWHRRLAVNSDYS
jgi:phospholipid/cholesterol/gamma-HCH transport system ATP-binding protein